MREILNKISGLMHTVLSLSSGSTFLIQPASKGLFFCPPLIFSQQGLRYYKQPVNLSCRPTMLTQLFSHWSTITFTDLLTAAYLVFLVIFVFGCNYLFTNFVDSKPEGRKTVLGQLPSENYRSVSTKTNIIYYTDLSCHSSLLFLISKLSKGECGDKPNFCHSDRDRIFSYFTQVEL